MAFVYNCYFTFCECRIAMSKIMDMSALMTCCVLRTLYKSPAPESLMKHEAVLSARRQWHTQEEAAKSFMVATCTQLSYLHSAQHIINTTSSEQSRYQLITCLGWWPHSPTPATLPLNMCVKDGYVAPHHSFMSCF